MIYTTVKDFERLKREKTACFTGHRPEKFTEDIIPAWAMPKFKKKLNLYIMIAVSQGYDTFLTGMQRGVDIWAAKEVILLKSVNPSIRLICISPYADEVYSRSGPDRADYEEVKAGADGYIALAQKYSDGCYKERNYFMVDHSSLVISVFSGQQRSGTAQTLRYARQQGLKISNIDPSSIAAGV